MVWSSEEASRTIDVTLSAEDLAAFRRWRGRPVVLHGPAGDPHEVISEKEWGYFRSWLRYQKRASTGAEPDAVVEGEA